MIKLGRKKAFVCLSVILCLASAGLAQAVGLAVRPKEIRLKGQPGQVLSSEFLVANIDNQPSIYYASSGQFKKELKIEPAEFVLSAGETKVLKLTFSANWPKTYQTEISVVARPPDAGGLAAAGGIKIPFSAEITGWPKLFLIYGFLAAVLICLIIYFGVKLLSVKRKKI